MHEWPITVTQREAPGSLAIGDHCHNNRQLVVNQLTMLRYRSGYLDEGSNTWMERTILSGTPDAMTVRLATDSVHRVTICVPGTRVGDIENQTVYQFDNLAHTLTSQEFTAGGEPLTEPFAYGDDRRGNAALTQLYRTLFAFNNTPAAPEV